MVRGAVAVRSSTWLTQFRKPCAGPSKGKWSLAKWMRKKHFVQKQILACFTIFCATSFLSHLGQMQKRLKSEVGISANLRRDELQRCQPPISKGKDLTELRHPDGLRASAVAFCGDLVKEVFSEGGPDEEIKEVHNFLPQICPTSQPTQVHWAGIFVWVGSARPKTATFGCGGSPSCRNGRPTASKESLGRGVA